MQVLEGNERSGGWCASGPLGDWADSLFSRTWKHSIGFNKVFHTIHGAISVIFSCFVLRKCTETHGVVAGPLLHAWTLWQSERRWQGLHRASPPSGSGLCTVGWASTAYTNALVPLVCLPDILKHPRDEFHRQSMPACNVCSCEVDLVVTSSSPDSLNIDWKDPFTTFQILSTADFKMCVQLVTS